MGPRGVQRPGWYGGGRRPLSALPSPVGAQVFLTASAAEHCSSLTASAAEHWSSLCCSDFLTTGGMLLYMTLISFIGCGDRSTGGGEMPARVVLCGPALACSHHFGLRLFRRDLFGSSHLARLDRRRLKYEMYGLLLAGVLLMMLLALWA